MFQIAAFLITTLSPFVLGSGVLSPHIAAPAVHIAPAAPALRYRLVAPQNIRPFAAQVSTFTRGLNVFDAPYAAGVLNAPAIVPRAIVPGIPPVPPVPVGAAPVPGFDPSAVFPAPVSAVAPAPVIPAPALGVASAPAFSLGPGYPGVAPAPVYPASVAAPAFPAFGPAPAVPAFAAAPAPFVPAVPAPVIPAPPVAPVSLLPGPFARSIHAVSPGVPPFLPHAALLR